MILTLDLPTDLEGKLSQEAMLLNLPLTDYILELLKRNVIDIDQPKNGAELVAYWHKEGVIGCRSDITDSQAHARYLRQQAENRE